MRRIRKPPAVVVGLREAQAIAANLGRDARSTRIRRRLTQAKLGALVGLGQSEISYLERGHGARTSIESWVAIGIALERPVAIGFGRDVVQPLQDAGHLAAQELLIRLARAAGWRAAFEVPSDPRAPQFSTDIVLERAVGERAVGERAAGVPAASDRVAGKRAAADRAADEHVLVEIWNRLDDLGAAIRSSDRKAVEVAADGRVVQVLWLLVDASANRAIARRFPAILRDRFPASSAGWVRALTGAGPAPTKPGLAWIDVGADRLRELRLAPA